MKVKVQIINSSPNALPKYAKEGDAGMDIHAWVNPEYSNVGDTTFKLMAGTRALIHTGIKSKIPSGYQIEVRPRSGLALKHGIMVLNSPGTIDENYIGEICIILYNTSDINFTIRNGDRIAQLVLMKSPKIEWDIVDTLEDTNRGSGGFGHTGGK